MPEYIPYSRSVPTPRQTREWWLQRACYWQAKAYEAHKQAIWARELGYPEGVVYWQDLTRIYSNDARTWLFGALAITETHHGK